MGTYARSTAPRQRPPHRLTDRRALAMSPTNNQAIDAGAALSAPDFATFYTPGPKGYTEYPTPRRWRRSAAPFEV